MGQSTNQNYLVISGGDEWSLYHACQAFGLDPEGMVLVKQATIGCIQIGPKGTDPERCIILANGRRDNEDAWSLIDYREAVSDADLKARKKALSGQLHPEVRNAVKIESTQDLAYRERALR